MEESPAPILDPSLTRSVVDQDGFEGCFDPILQAIIRTQKYPFLGLQFTDSLDFSPMSFYGHASERNFGS